MITEVREYHVGSGWLFECKSCGHRASCDHAAPATCPGCGRAGWWYRCTTGDTFTGGDWMFDANDLRKRCNSEGVAPLASIDRQESIKLPLNHTVEPSPVAQLEGGRVPSRNNGHRGRPAFIIPDEDMRAFVDRGLGCKLIARELASKGIMVHWTTVAHHLKKYRSEN